MFNIISFNKNYTVNVFSSPMFTLVFSSSVTMKSKSNKEDAVWQKIFENIIVLNNEYKTAVLLTYFSKSGQLFFGPSNVTCKMKTPYNCTCNCTCEVDNGVCWEEAFFTDNRDLIIVGIKLWK